MKLCAAAVALLIATAFAAAPALAVDEGVPDRDGHPYVGVLGADPDGDGPQTPFLWCSGSVVSDSVFLTAAHCIVALPPETVWYVSLAAGSPRTPIYPPVLPGEDFLAVPGAAHKGKPGRDPSGLRRLRQPHTRRGSGPVPAEHLHRR